MQSERKQAFIAYAQQEVAQYRAGELPRVSTHRELAARFGYKSPGMLSTVLKEAGIVREGTVTTSEKPCVIPGPSRELSWFIGVVASGGSNDPKTGAIEVAENDAAFLEAFKITGEMLFEVNATKGTRRIVNKARVNESQLITFSNTRMARFLGDLRRNKWPETLQEHHGWIMQQAEFLTGFIEGFFDRRGDIYSYNQQSGGRHQAVISTSSRHAVNMLSNLLTLLHIEGISPRESEKNIEGVSGITISGLDNIRSFARLIHSVLPEKEARLAAYRERYDESGRKIVHTDEELFGGWKTIVSKLGHPPSRSELNALSKAGDTDFSPSVFAIRFGGGSFIRARDFLNSSLGVSQETGGQKQYRQLVEGEEKDGKSRQVMFTDDDLCKEWLKIQALLGRKVTYTDIDKLHKMEETRISAGTYANRFGNGSFVKAREALERMIAERARQKIESEVGEIEGFKAERQILQPRQLLLEGSEWDALGQSESKEDQIFP